MAYLNALVNIYFINYTSIKSATANTCSLRSLSNSYSFKGVT